jgi:hypothetical protein
MADVPTFQSDLAVDRYRAVARANSRDNHQWSTEAMQKAANITYAHAHQLRHLHGSMEKVNAILSDLTDNDISLSDVKLRRFEQIYGRHMERESNQVQPSWQLADMQNAADGITTATANMVIARLNPSTAVQNIRTTMAPVQAFGARSGHDRYTAVLDYNEANNTNWNVKDMEHAAEIDDTSARLIRRRRAQAQHNAAANPTT